MSKRRDDILVMMRAQNARISVINWHISSYTRERSQLEASVAKLRGHNDYLDKVPKSRNPFGATDPRRRPWLSGWKAEQKLQESI